MKTKEFEINVVVYHPENKYSEDEIMEMFVTWVESKGMFAGGGVRELNESEKTKNRKRK
jgi:hypothetical protein